MPFNMQKSFYTQKIGAPSVKNGSWKEEKAR